MRLSARASWVLIFVGLSAQASYLAFRSSEFWKMGNELVRTTPVLLFVVFAIVMGCGFVWSHWNTRVERLRPSVWYAVHQQEIQALPLSLTRPAPVRRKARVDEDWVAHVKKNAKIHIAVSPAEVVALKQLFAPDPLLGEHDLSAKERKDVTKRLLRLPAKMLFGNAAVASCVYLDAPVAIAAAERRDGTWHLTLHYTKSSMTHVGLGHDVLDRLLRHLNRAEPADVVLALPAHSACESFYADFNFTLTREEGDTRSYTRRGTITQQS
jgi:hypothetical protein